MPRINKKQLGTNRAFAKEYGKSFQSIYNDRRWKRIRNMMIAQAPFCVHCAQNGIATGDKLELDHITPLSTDSSDPYDPNNLQLLCRHHHAQKTANERNEKRTY